MLHSFTLHNIYYRAARKWLRCRPFPCLVYIAAVAARASGRLFLGSCKLPGLTKVPPHERNRRGHGRTPTQSWRSDMWNASPRALVAQTARVTRRRVLAFYGSIRAWHLNRRGPTLSSIRPRSWTQGASTMRPLSEYVPGVEGGIERSSSRSKFRWLDRAAPSPRKSSGSRSLAAATAASCRSTRLKKGLLPVSVVALSLALPAGASAQHRSCPQFTITARDYRSVENLTIHRGTVSCAEAERVVRDFTAGRGIEHGSGPEADKSWTVDGWTCGHGAGGGACLRGGADGRSASNYRTAKDYIEYWIAGYWEYHNAAPSTSEGKGI
jgi:hypothetical protein